MGVLMVRKEVKRGTSLLMGISVALLLGAAATFLMLALPQQMLEGLTTSIGLSRIMVQAEPPISPNDRMLLAILAGLGTAGIGWVLVDWLLFGRAGMSAIIRPREDDYEDDEDFYRPSDPLDPRFDAPSVILPQPVNLSADPRRPLSARTDIGDPPVPSFGAVQQGGGGRGTYDISADHVLPPLDQLLPEASIASPPVVGPSGSGSSALPPLELPGAAALDMPDIPMRAPTPGPLVLPTAAEIAAGAVTPRAAPPSPSPSVIPEPVILPEPAPAAGLMPEWAKPPAPAAPSPSLSETIPPAPIMPELRDERFASFPPNLPDFLPGDAPFLSPPPKEPAIFQAPPPIAPEPVIAPPAAMTPPPAPFFTEPVAPPPVARAPVSEPAPAAPSRRSSVAPDRDRLEDLLARLEHGMLKRRSASAPQPIDTYVAPPAAEPARRPLPVYASAPPQMIDVPPPYVPPTSPPLAAVTPAPPVQVAPEPLAPPASVFLPQPPAPSVTVAPASQTNDGLLDQPLHVALDVLRNRVRRMG